MGYEYLTTTQEDIKSDNSEYEKLLEQYRMLFESSKLNDPDKQQCRNWLETKPTLDELKISIKAFPESEESQMLVYEYGDKMDKKIGKGVFAEKSRKAYLDWFKALQLSEKRLYLDASAIDDPRREEFLEMYKHLPQVERERIKDEFFVGNFEDRQQLIIPLFKKHKELKEVFFKLPKEIQEKYRDQFKKSTLQDREKLLEAIAAINQQENDGSTEEAREESLLKAFQKETFLLVKENLLSPASKIAYDLWYETMPLKQKRHMLKNSEIHTRLPDRIKTRDAFYNLPESIRKSHELRFRNYDLDRRKELLKELQKSEIEKIPKVLEKKSYPEIVMKRVLAESLKYSGLTQSRIIFTEISKAHGLRKRAELARNTKKNREIARKTQAMGGKVDEAQIIDITELRNHGENRFRLKKWLKTKQNPDALATNMTLLDNKKEEVTADQFEKLILHPQQEELLAALVEHASRKLPGVDRTKLKRLAASMDLTVDLLKVAA